MELKAGDAVVVKDFILCKVLLLIFFIYLNSQCSIAQDIPGDEIDANVSSYFDNFRVDVVYPSVRYNKKLSDNTAVSARYLTDIISAASMRCAFQIDGLTTATSKKVGGARVTPNEWRHEVGLGLQQKIFSGVFSLNGSYSIEHDYSSKTLSFDIRYPFAKKNTEIQIGFLGSFDKVFPVIWTWTRERNTLSFNSILTQILSQSLIAQLDFSYIAAKGYMLDGYQVVRIVEDSTLLTVLPNEPDFIVRRAIGFRTNAALTKTLTLQVGYRYYWDTWDVRSHTISGTFSKNFGKNYSLSVEYRQYYQTRAYFFQPEYTQVEQYMTVNSYLNSGYTNELSLNFIINGDKHFSFPFINRDNVQFNTRIGFFHRYTDSPDWIMGFQHLYAYLFNIGIRYFL